MILSFTQAKINVPHKYELQSDQVKLSWQDHKMFVNQLNIEHEEKRELESSRMEKRF